MTKKSKEKLEYLKFKGLSMKQITYIFLGGENPTLKSYPLLCILLQIYFFENNPVGLKFSITLCIKGNKEIGH